GPTNRGIAMKIARRFATATLCLLAAACLPLRADEAKNVQRSEAVVIEPDVVYGHKDGMALTFDVVKPAKANGAGILGIQTGGWYSNWVDPKGWPNTAKSFLDKGWTVFIVRHGSAPKYTIPEATGDVRRSVRFIRMKAKDYGVDPERLGVTGGSAGGHLSLMLATTGDDGDASAKDEVLKQSDRV